MARSNDPKTDIGSKEAKEQLRKDANAERNLRSREPAKKVVEMDVRDPKTTKKD